MLDDDLDGPNDAHVETCKNCGGSTSAGGDALPCLCELAPLEPVTPEARMAAERGGAGNEARALRCPSCGGWLESGRRRCNYCEVELASVRCWRCFELSFAGSSNCARCGATFRLEGDLGPSTHPCPACDTEVLHRIDVGEHRVFECPACAGIHLDHDTLERLTREQEAEAGLRLIGAKKAEVAIETEVKYRSCPMCTKIMSRRNFGNRSGVIIDWCKADGVWFDADELTAVLSFVATGGLKESRAAELTGARDELRKRRTAAISAQMHMPASRPVSSHSAGALLSAIVEAVLWI